MLVVTRFCNLVARATMHGSRHLLDMLFLFCLKKEKKRICSPSPALSEAYPAAPLVQVAGYISSIVLVQSQGRVMFVRMVLGARRAACSCSSQKNDTQVHRISLQNQSYSAPEFKARFSAQSQNKQNMPVFEEKKSMLKTIHRLAARKNIKFSKR